MYGMIALKLLIGLIALMIVVRVLGKKEMAKITALDFVYLLILGGILEEAIYDEQVTIAHLLFALTIWAVAVYLFEEIMQKSDKIRVVVMGNPALIIKEGKLDNKVLKKAMLDIEQLRTLLRQQGIFSFREVQYAYLETNGTISVMKYAAFEPTTPEDLKIEVAEEEPSILLVDEGKIEEQNLRIIGKDEEWLRDNLKNEGYEQIEEIYFAEWTEKAHFYIQTYKSSTS